MDNVLLILTCTINVNYNKIFLHQTNPAERLQCYLKSIINWLEKTNLKICVVENSGYTFPELDEYKTKYINRFEVLTFNEYSLPEHLQDIIYNNSKGSSELYSIIYTYNNTKFKNDINFVIKITGRYFVPTFEAFLIDIGIKNRCNHVGIHDDKHMIIGLRQSNNDRCEILGIHTILFDMLFNINLYDSYGDYTGHVETIYKNRLKLLDQNKVLTCPSFNIEPTQMGGLNSIISEL